MISKKIFLLCLIIFTFKISFAQITFQKTFGGDSSDYGYSVQQTTDGGYIIVGSTKSFGAGNKDVYLIKTDSTGNTLWTRTFGGINDDDGYSVQQTTDGGYIITGNTQSFGAGGVDVYLIKTDTFGDTLWTKTFGGTSFDYGYSVQQTFDGGYIITGETFSFNGNGDVYLIRVASNGNLVWTKIFGGTNADWGYCIRQTNDSGYVILGTTLSFGAGIEDVYLIKTDANGDTIWTKTYGGMSHEAGSGVMQTTDGGYIITGNTQSFTTGGRDVCNTPYFLDQKVSLLS